MSEHTSLEIDGDFLVISHEDQYDRGEVIISEDGGLTVNDQAVATDSRSRRLLRRFFSEAAQLEDQALLQARETTDLDAEAAAYATAALRSLAAGGQDREQDDPGEPDYPEPLDETVDFAEEAGEPTEKLRELAEELRDRIPELAELDWFLDP